MKKSEIEAVFTKEQLKNSSYFSNKADLISALLDDNKKYTIKAAEKILQKFLEREV